MTEATGSKVLFNPDGTFTSPKVLRRAKILNTVAGCLGALWFSLVVGQYLPLFARKFGAGQVAIGLLATIPSLAHGFQILSAYIVERLGRRKPFWAFTELSRRLAMGLAVLLPFIFTPDHYQGAVIALLAILAVSSIMGSAGFSPWYSWMADIIPERERGRFWGVRGMFVNGSLIVLVPIFGAILEHFQKGDGTLQGGPEFTGFIIMFVAATVIGVVDITVHSFIPEPPMKKTSEGISLSTMIMRPLKDRDFRNFFLGWGLWQFGTLVTTPFYSVYYKEELGVGYEFLGYLFSMAVAAGVAGWWFWGEVIDRLGSRPVFNICTIASIPTLALFFMMTPDNAKALLSVQSLYGGFIGSGMGIGFTNLLLGLSPREGRGMFVAVFFSVTGLLSAPAPYIGGLISDRFPEFFILGGFTRYHNLIFISACIYVACLPFFLRIRERKAAPIGEVLSNIMFTNPVRTFARLGILNAGRSVRSSVNAVRDLGTSRTRLATEDLLARLDDPSVIVREAAIEALGEIGDADAAPALIERLKDREAYSSLAIIKALARIKDERSVETLISFLDDEDRHVRAAAARGLGALGSGAAVKPLKALIQRETKPQVIANAIEALGDIGHTADMWEILPYLRNIKNHILKRQMALAVGNLLGKRDEFYSIISTERRQPGKAVAKLIKRLCATISLRRPQAGFGGFIMFFRKPRGAHPIDGELDRLFGDFKRAYAAQDVRRCVTALSDAGYHIARTVYSFEGPRDMLLEVAVLRDARFAAGLWFLRMLETGEIEPTMDDALLGLYFLTSAEYRDVVRLS